MFFNLVIENLILSSSPIKVVESRIIQQGRFQSRNRGILSFQDHEYQNSPMDAVGLPVSISESRILSFQARVHECRRVRWRRFQSRNRESYPFKYESRRKTLPKQMSSLFSISESRNLILSRWYNRQYHWYYTKSVSISESRILSFQSLELISCGASFQRLFSISESRILSFQVEDCVWRKRMRQWGFNLGIENLILSSSLKLEANEKHLCEFSISESSILSFQVPCSICRLSQLDSEQFSISESSILSFQGSSSSTKASPLGSFNLGIEYFIFSRHLDRIFASTVGL